MCPEGGGSKKVIKLKEKGMGVKGWDGPARLLCPGLWGLQARSILPVVICPQMGSVRGKVGAPTLPLGHEEDSSAQWETPKVPW